MGCFNLQGFYSNLPITCGEKTVALLCVKSKHADREAPIYATDYMEVMCLPIFGEYNDYGTIEHIQPSETTRLIEEKSGMSIDKFIENIVCECNGETFDELIKATKDKNQYHYTEPGVLKFFKNTLQKKPNLEEYINKKLDGIDENSDISKELKETLLGLQKYETERLKSVSLCVIFERRDVYEAMIEIAKEKKSDYFWATYEELEQTWDKYYNFCKDVETKYGVKLNMIGNDSDDDIFNNDKLIEHYTEIKELKAKHGIEGNYKSYSPYHFVKCGGFEDYINILYEGYEGDMNIFKEEYLNYSMFYAMFLKLHGVFNFSPYGSQEYPYLSAIKLKKKEVEILEKYVNDWIEYNKDDETLKPEECLD